MSGLAAGLALGTACGFDTAAASGRLTIDVRCAADSDCPGAFACEGTGAASVCRSDDTAAGCPVGYEAETEHGQTFCKPHGGTGSDGPDGGVGGGSGSDAGGVGGGSGGGSATCSVDADCPDGQECETEEEHGQTTSICKPHGGGDD